MSLLKGFLLFWYDFLVGDSIALAIGGVLILIFGYVLVQLHVETIAQVLLPIAAIATLLISLPEARRRS